MCFISFLRYTGIHTDLVHGEDDSSLLSFVDTSSHAVSKLEADLYYRGIRGQNRLGPKLIYRSSKDVFTPPSEPERYFRTMELLPATHHDKLGQNNLWETIRSKVSPQRFS